MTFAKPDTVAFPNLTYAFRALEIGGTMPCAINAANEIAVNAFLNNKIKFLDIARAVENALLNHKPINNYTLEDVYRIDIEVRELTEKFLAKQ